MYLRDQSTRSLHTKPAVQFSTQNLLKNTKENSSKVWCCEECVPSATEHPATSKFHPKIFNYVFRLMPITKYHTGNTTSKCFISSLQIKPVETKQKTKINPRKSLCFRPHAVC